MRKERMRKEEKERIERKLCLLAVKEINGYYLVY